MARDNTVVFKSNSKEITVLLNKDASFEKILESLKKKLSEAKTFFASGKLPLTFKGRDLTEEEELILIKTVSEETGVDITYVRIEGKHRPIIEEQIEVPIDSALNMTTYHKGSIRSGQTLKSKGSVVIIGDINPGGEVTAAGNITVLGYLYGKAHAGCDGNLKCFVFALRLLPIQLRIADVITYIPKELSKSQRKSAVPSYAFVEDNRIYIAPRL